ncbi:protein-disulfide isomerase [Scopulibacillus darangshiensis]|uniref:Protein-disulfide isomerase n=1 Tax=Scopulibacillus darangshiensis TaxID=442528 RepID=A0A4R2NFP0_9BACL|nr:thioredoxin domain-containing protein [Scopulibacillus darangshiensis]TCP19982.1 protein-disulfide isomerase [Scopulibacillus darangshiensis]
MSKKHEQILKEKRRRERDEQKRKRKQRQIVVISTVLVVVLVLAIVTIIFQNQEDGGQAVNRNGGSSGQETTAKIDYSGQPSIGKSSAPVKIAEFGDYKCIYCKKFEETVFPKLKKDFIDKGKVQFYFINFPIIDKSSQLAANAGEAVYHQDPIAFWNFHKTLYEKQGDEREDWVTKELLTNIAKKTVPSLDVKKFQASLKDNAYQNDVIDDYNMAKSLGITSTPSLFINGQQVSPFDYNKIKETIREAATNKGPNNE